MAPTKLKASKIATARRRRNLFKKAAELSTLCGARVAIVSISEKGKVSMYQNSDTVIHRYLTGKGCLKSTSSGKGLMNLSKRQCLEVAKKEGVPDEEELRNNAAAEEGFGHSLIDLNLNLNLALALVD
ncbi:hypothetical protein REPUB_Repub05bG0087500 [Reevesia pubescens]